MLDLALCSIQGPGYELNPGEGLRSLRDLFRFDEAWSTTVYQSNNGRVLAAIDPAGAITTNFWDAAGEQIAAQNANGYLCTTTFDRAGRVLAAQNPVGAMTTNGYDPKGQRITVTESLNRVSSTVYDGDRCAAIYTGGTPTAPLHDCVYEIGYCVMEALA